MKHVQKVVNDIIINNIFPPTSTNYVIYVKSKTTYIILRRIDSEEAFSKTKTIFSYNIIYKQEVYNKDIFYSYL